MLISKDNDGKVIGWMETYFSDNKSVIVNASRNISTITARDRTTGKVEVKAFFGKPLLPSDSSNGKK